jgi:hypothetical protein
MRNSVNNPMTHLLTPHKAHKADKAYKAYNNPDKHPSQRSEKHRTNPADIPFVQEIEARLTSVLKEATYLRNRPWNPDNVTR